MQVEPKQAERKRAAHRAALSLSVSRRYGTTTKFMSDTARAVLAVSVTTSRTV
jgi:hypothetical protein